MWKQGRFFPLRVWLAGMLLLLLVFLSTACSDNQSTLPPPATKDLIARSQKAIQQVRSYHFHLTTDNAGSSGGDALVVTDATGDMVTPDKLQARADATVNKTALQVDIVAIGAREYYTDPITGRWTRTNDLLDPRTLSDAQTGVSAMLGNFHATGRPTAGSVTDRTCWYVTGQLPARYLAAITQGGTPTEGTVQASICVGETDYYPYQIRIQGVVIQGDTAETQRIFTLSDFNTPVSINEPKLP
ncbi:hypothetical protein KDA_17000 [Dictyobacter alpinus]|uniref:LppX_LprAFG lipoprotein n=1 Tax=Dictyobacter alpinus TaxID=2014873 RepID=A0A402B4E3_9CHLR|nr:LppX_LprAFG lipoprotein [Dictyobacter alpinus]GCE26216.1 hypothetical protein KDA_17000 [Dictyobacter alpinus]